MEPRNTAISWWAHEISSERNGTSAYGAAETVVGDLVAEIGNRNAVQGRSPGLSGSENARYANRLRDPTDL